MRLCGLVVAIRGATAAIVCGAWQRCLPLMVSLLQSPLPSFLLWASGPVRRSRPLLRRFPGPCPRFLCRRRVCASLSVVCAPICALVSCVP